MTMQHTNASAIVGALLVSAALTACSAMQVGSSAATPSTSPSTGPSGAIASASPSAVRFVSALYPYAVDLPTGWTVLRSSQVPGSDQDAFADADGSTSMTVNSGRPEPGQTVADRVTLARRWFPECTSLPADDVATQMGGEPGVMWSYTCSDSYNLNVQTIRDRIGYRITVSVPPGAMDQARDTMTELLRGFVFTDGPAGSPDAP
jgi:hypothetical protein